MRITTEGPYNMTAEQYHADPCPDPSLSSSIARTILDKSPLHAWHAHPRLNPEHEPEATKEQDLGTAAHAAFLEGTTDRITWVDAQDWRTKAAQTARDEARAGGLVPLLKKQEPDLLEMLERANDAVAASELGQLLNGPREIEQVLCWREGSAWCRARLDLRVDELVLDYKTSTTANPGAFINMTLDRLGYDVRAGFYMRGVKAVCGHPDPKYVWVVQESKQPFDVSLVGLGPALKEMAYGKAEQAIRTWRECMESNRWPGYTKRICWAEPTTRALYKWADTPMEVS